MFADTGKRRALGHAAPTSGSVRENRAGGGARRRLGGVVELYRRQQATDGSEVSRRRFESRDEPFDPGFHEAVMSEESGEDGQDSPIVAEVLRTGYAWNGKVLRPAMVKVRS